MPALEQTLSNLSTDYVDLYLVTINHSSKFFVRDLSVDQIQIHWPQAYAKLNPYTLFPEDENGHTLMANVPLSSTWRAMEELVKAGKARSIGVSNFSQEQLQEILGMYVFSIFISRLFI